jgi:hypothetical protein
MKQNDIRSIVTIYSMEKGAGIVRYVSIICGVLLWTAAAMAGEDGSGRLSGSWVPPGMGPIPAGLIYAFNTNAGPPPDIGGARRVPDGVAITDAEGKFSLELAEGTYYLSTWKKVGGPAPGPPQDGDLHALSRDEKGVPVTYRVNRGATTGNVILRQASVFKSPAVKISDGMTAITGIVKGGDGAPMADAVVQVYTNQEIKGKPSFVSYKTGTDGKYVVQIDREGTYFLTVRSRYSGGRPQSGDAVGIYGGEIPRPVTVKTRNVTRDVDIQVGQFIDRRPT